MWVGVFLTKCVPVSVRKQVTVCALAWSIAIMEYLGWRPFTAESPGNTKVHQGIIYSSVTARLWVRDGLECMAIHIHSLQLYGLLWTYFYACVLCARRSRVHLVVYWSQLIPRALPSISKMSPASCWVWAKPLLHSSMASEHYLSHITAITWAELLDLYLCIVSWK